MIQRRKVLSLGVCLVIVALIASVISGCAGPGPGPEPEPGDEVPIYGGELNYLLPADIVGWDDAIVPHYNVAHGGYQCLWSGDWAKGIAGDYGSNDCTWYIPGAINRLDNIKGYIAESYEINDDYLIFNIRPGMHWFDKYPCNGREVTADDVVFSLERQMTTSTAYLYTNYPQVVAAMSVSKVDEDTVRIDCDDQAAMAELLSMIDFIHIYPQDAVELYGDLNDWERVIGCGPFMLEDYVEGSTLHYVRNDDYWETYPVIGSPSDGDQLPYLDGYNVFIQPDPATQDSLFTTGQVDILYCDFDRAEGLKASCPDANYIKYFPSGGAILVMRLDHEGEPWTDVRVRQAMQLAIDNQLMVDQIFGGEGEVLYWPVGPSTEYANAYVPLEDLEDDTFEVLPGRTISVADLFGYDLELAQDLMEAAGCEGFQATVSVWNYYVYMDQLQVAKEMLADINVDITIDPVDWATISMIFVFRNYETMLYGAISGIGTYFKGINWSGTGMWNQGYIDDPYLNDVRDQMLAAYPDEAAVDQIHAEMIPYLLEQCYVTQLCAPNSYRFWWPWVKNYSGEGSIGYYKGFGSFLQYVWIDEELKEDMGY